MTENVSLNGATKKPHWTQTEQGRKRVAQITKARWRKGLYKKKGKGTRKKKMGRPSKNKSALLLLINALDEAGAKALLRKIILSE